MGLKAKLIGSLFLIFGTLKWLSSYYSPPENAIQQGVIAMWSVEGLLMMMFGILCLQYKEVEEASKIIPKQKTIKDLLQKAEPMHTK